MDGYFTTKSKEEMAKAHEMSDVPVIANFNSGESSSPLQGAKTVAEYKQIASRLYGKNVDEFLKLYPVASDAEVAAKQARSRANPPLRVLPAAAACSKRSTSTRKSTSICMTASILMLRVLRLPTRISRRSGPITTATSFIGLKIWTYTTRCGTPGTGPPWDHTLADDMSDALIAFAKTGDPSTAAVKWPAWSPASDAFVNFGDSIKVRNFNTQGMEWLAAHRVQGGGRGGGAAGVVPGAGPRD